MRFVIGFALGAAIGAVLAAMLTGASGEALVASIRARSAPGSDSTPS
jgi:hypothetical protein